MRLPVMPPVKPMLAKASREIPTGDFLYEPKWDGFRCIVFRDGDELELGSRNEKPLTRYFPELIEPLKRQLPDRCVVDGELVVPSEGGLDFDLLSQRIHPAESRVKLLAEQWPASMVAFDILALDELDLRGLPLTERREALEELLGDAADHLHLTPATTDPQLANEWFDRFDGSGFDGVMAKALSGTYVENKRVQSKVKHHRTADCVVAGYRPHKQDGIGSLILGLFDDGGPDGEDPRLHQVGVCSAFSAAQRRTLAGELAEYELNGAAGHPWSDWANPDAHGHGVRMPGSRSRWSGSKSSEWVPLRIELVAEVTYENYTSGRFRHPARFVRWRPDKVPSQCTFDQVAELPPPEFAQIFR